MVGSHRYVLAHRGPRRRRALWRRALQLTETWRAAARREKLPISLVISSMSPRSSSVGSASCSGCVWARGAWAEGGRAKVRCLAEVVYRQRWGTWAAERLCGHACRAAAEATGSRALLDLNRVRLPGCSQWWGREALMLLQRHGFRGEVAFVNWNYPCREASTSAQGSTRDRLIPCILPPPITTSAGLSMHADAFMQLSWHGHYI